MNKSTNFTGQPIFSQVLKLVDRSEINRISRKHSSDRYYKKFTTWVHLVSMLYGTLSKCHAIRELTTGMLACEGKLNHLGLIYSPKRSTLSDGNKNRSSAVFKSIYEYLYKQYESVLSDSRNKNEILKRVYIADSTTITLFKEILKGSGRKRLDGKQKGGIKAHTIVKADMAVAQFIHYTSAAVHDKCLIKEFSLVSGDFICFDKAYIDYKQFYKWSDQQIYYVTRMKDNAVYEMVEELNVPESSDDCVIKDDIIQVTTTDEQGEAQQLKMRKVTYWNAKKEKFLVFITNHFDLPAQDITMIYKRRWHIEKLFKKLKQNFPLKYFLGDNKNAIEIQIWVALIAMLLLTVIRAKVTKSWAFSNMVSMVSHHLMNYIDVVKFLNNPEKAWTEKNRANRNQINLFSSA